MRVLFLSLAVGLTLVSSLAWSAPPGSCGSFGTTVEFVSNPSEAARQAKQEQKLVFVLHVSGHFEDPKFT